MSARDVAIAKILTYKDEHVDPHLPPEVRREFRKVVLDAVNEIGEPISNALYLDRLEAIHGDVEAIRQAVT